MDNPPAINHSPAALLLVADGCSVCPVVHKILIQLEQEKFISQLEVINITQQPELAQQYGVRSVPWFRIGDLEFQGLHGAAELRYWAQHGQQQDGMRKYMIEQFEAGQLPVVERLIRRQPRWLAVGLSLIADMEAPIQARIGLGAVLENLQNQQVLRDQVTALSALARHADSRVRGDACYYLGLSGSPEALPSLNDCLTDANADVREIAREAIEMISG